MLSLVPPSTLVPSILDFAFNCPQSSLNMSAYRPNPLRQFKLNKFGIRCGKHVCRIHRVMMVVFEALGVTSYRLNRDNVCASPAYRTWGYHPLDILHTSNLSSPTAQTIFVQQPSTTCANPTLRYLLPSRIKLESVMILNPPSRQGEDERQSARAVYQQLSAGRSRPTCLLSCIQSCRVRLPIPDCTAF
ncbi:hypothetical protein BDQ12DRAFT_240889 [Crucibulum laeve]|uniref:Uncharacterized protein n=1 Tax=Crucibulum laeve TaxID=68775 RepID=A0A5C3LDQ7_9AGAR|nr:hypothetical protein BDQ12DRAFT_240889 [Crucibulum laeve]